ncbi:hypothetical protein D3C76_1040270 [compost metagenome]
MRVAQGTRRAKVNGYATVKPFVVGRWHLGKHHQAQVNPGYRVAGVRIDEVGHLRRAFDQHVGFIATDFHAGGDGQLAQAMAGVFKHGGAGVETVRNIAQQGTHVAVSHVFQLGDAGAHLLHTVAVKQLDQVPLADGAGAVLRIKVAFLVGTGAHVGQQQVDHVLAALAV